MDENESLIKFSLKAVRPGKKDGFWHIFTLLIVKSAQADSLLSIKLVTDAALMLSDNQNKELGIDRNRVKTFNMLSNCLLNPIKNRYDKKKVSLIAWGFADMEENYKRYIEPWENGFDFYPSDFMNPKKVYRRFYCRRCVRQVYLEQIDNLSERERVPEFCIFCGFTLDNRHKVFFRDYFKAVTEPRWSFFFDATRNALSQSGYQKLVNSFSTWTHPHTQRIKGKLASLVPKSRFDEIINLLEKQNPPDENESSMD